MLESGDGGRWTRSSGIREQRVEERGELYFARGKEGGGGLIE